MQQDDFVDVATSASVPAAEAAVARLRAAGIDARLRGTDAPGGVDVTSEAAVMVPAGQVAAAMELLRDSAAPDIDDDGAAAPEDSAPTTAPSAEPVVTELARIRRRQRLMWFWFFSYLPAVVAITLAGGEAIIVPVALYWLTAYLLAGALATNSRCPRCGKRYCRDEARWDPYTQHCLNCGLALRQPAEAG